MEIPLSSCLDTSQIRSSAKCGLERFLRNAATSWFFNVLFLLSNKFGLGLTVACLGVYVPLYLFFTYLGRTRANLTRPRT
ncbi:hypothetical protein P692DRAFT_20826902 [Suillus brevipes Sb2]|nr:hypothetical protein P692DRAFT_20826902 [Suillus brevipes Sb2]